jgi:hypothetical protein
MKKKVVIFMDIDTTKQDSSAVRTGMPSPNMPEVPGVESYTVYVRGDDGFGKPIDSAAHELGHMLSSVFELPTGMKNDPRTTGELANNHGAPRTINQMDRIYSNERLAWKLAEKIKPDLDPEDKQKCLDSYLDGYQGLREAA